MPRDRQPHLSSPSQSEFRPSNPCRPPTNEPPSGTALIAVVGTWLFAVLAMGVVHTLPLANRGEPDSWQLRPPALVIVSIGSLMVALVAFIPNLFRPTSVDSSRQQRDTTDPANPSPDSEFHEPANVTGERDESDSDDLTHHGSNPPIEATTRQQTDASSVNDKQSSPDTVGDLGWAASFLFGLLIRIAGTVALFLFSSYQSLGAPISLAGWILGWHALLLAAGSHRAGQHDPNCHPKRSSDGGDQQSMRSEPTEGTRSHELACTRCRKPGTASVRVGIGRYTGSKINNHTSSPMSPIESR